MDVEFRPAGAGDTDALIEMMRALYEYDGTPFDERTHRAALSHLLDDDRCGRVWLIRDGAETVGYVVLTFGFSLEFGGRDALIDELFVRADARGRGIGRRVLEFVAEECRARNIAAVHLLVERSNTVAQAVYRKCDFRDHDRDVMTRRLPVD